MSSNGNDSALDQQFANLGIDEKAPNGSGGPPRGKPYDGYNNRNSYSGPGGPPGGPGGFGRTGGFGGGGRGGPAGGGGYQGGGGGYPGGGPNRNSTGGFDRGQPRYNKDPSDEFYDRADVKARDPRQETALFGHQHNSGINFDKYDDIPVE
ncbi:hypothetical protein HK405_001380, partial [Cladochytrium tenue]